MSHRPGPARLLSAALILSLLSAAQAASAADASPAKAEEASTEQLRDRLAERLKDDAGSLKLNAKKAPADIKTSNPVDLRARKAAVKPGMAASAPRSSIPWGYTGEGAPDRWGQLQPEFRQCAIGTRQSPIDLRDTIKVDQEKIQFDYKPSNFSVVDNGHTIQVNVAPGNSIQIMGRRYELVQFHFHRPSEERINGRQFDMSVHLVHQDAEGRLATIAVLLERGQDQPLVQTVWNYLPLERGDAYEAPVPIDLGNLLPKERGYFSYMGSMTTPPCSEGVLWLVFRQPVPVSSQQITVFSRLYPMNARPLQAQTGRLIKESF
ncbi:MAG: carbonic anhydrase family protein [Mitsuaria chitosanitabida]|jgi:carbonic anhydrase|uniref:carbonic anhydrase n=1 Tax=Roseateles chitosanitabidus TaxID=65048 RepID=UPI001B1DBA96|nr:carbonic anhydrase family protein [Roseateles chitosanitabidus]MBO9689623.1 carbonic anhydrase family protein [Roseateles chitosanitabidus]